jgi:hypothetical protein
LDGTPGGAQGQPVILCARPWKSIAAFISMAIVKEYHGISPQNMAKNMAKNMVL